jgi:GNAT superfamily N-acetyltransferase
MSIFNLAKSSLTLLIVSNALFCDVQLRYATIDDLKALVTVHYNSWHATYDHMLPGAYCAKNSAEHLEKYWYKFFAKHDDRFALIAMDDNVPVGFITAGPIKQQIEQEGTWWSSTEYDCELYKLYVLPEYQGRGIGKLLLKTAFEKLYAQGYRKAIVRVFAQNTGAIGFYAHCLGMPLHATPITYWPEFPYYVYGFSIETTDIQDDMAPGVLGYGSNEVTLQSYESQINAYIEKTPPQVEGVFKRWIDATLTRVQQDAHIIEIGSAFGRDAAYIESKGFTVERTDAT